MGAFRIWAAAFFWLCAAGILYTYLLYPAILYVLSRLFGRRRQVALLEDAELPSVSLVIAAHNEEAVIERRIANALATDYPRQKLQIIVASDGSTDHTAEIVRRCAAQGVHLLDFPVRRGKATVVNAAMQEASGEIILLSDANTDTDPSAARRLAGWFTDPTVGIVCGRLILVDPKSGKNVDGLYWKYETLLKKRESGLGALLGSNGAIYAIRKSVFCPIPDGTIVDDFVIPLLAKLRWRCEIVYDWDAVAREESAPDMAGEFRRRSRIGAGGWQAIGLLWRLMDPRRGWIAFTFFSHKLLRWLGPFFMLGALAASALLCGSRLYAALLAAQVLFYLVAFVGGYVTRGVPLAPIFRLASMFVGMNAALLVGFFRWLTGSQGGAWTRTKRLDEVGARVGATVSSPAQDPAVVDPVQ